MACTNLTCTAGPGEPSHQPPCPGKTSVDATHADAGRGTMAFPMAGPGKGPVCAGVSAGVSSNHLRAANNIPWGVTRGDIGESITGLSLAITYLLRLPLLSVPRYLLEWDSHLHGLWWVLSCLTPCRTSAPVRSNHHPLSPAPTPDSLAEPGAPACTK